MNKKYLRESALKYSRLRENSEDTLEAFEKAIRKVEKDLIFPNYLSYLDSVREENTTITENTIEIVFKKIITLENYIFEMPPQKKKNMFTQLVDKYFEKVQAEFDERFYEDYYTAIDGLGITSHIDLGNALFHADEDGLYYEYDQELKNCYDVISVDFKVKVFFDTEEATLTVTAEDVSDKGNYVDVTMYDESFAAESENMDSFENTLASKFKDSLSYLA